MRAPGEGWTRAVAGLLLIASIAWMVFADSSRDSDGTVRLSESSGIGPLEALLTEAEGVAAVVRESAAAPTEQELALLQALSGRTRIDAVLPISSAELSIRLSGGRVAGQAGVLLAIVTAVDEPDLPLIVEGPGGVVDTIETSPAPDGRHEAALRIRPTRPGWNEWSVRYDDLHSTVGVWTRETERAVLIVSTAPSWEARFATRALQSSGFAVDAITSLGRGNVAGNVPSERRTSDYDAVLLFTHAAPSTRSDTVGARPSSSPLAALDWDGFIENDGGGAILVVGDADRATVLSDLGALGIEALGDAVLGRWSAGPSLSTAPTSASSIEWWVPVEVLSLPLWDREVLTSRWAGDDGARRPGAEVSTNGGAERILDFGWLGRGRVVITGLRESWRWRMEGDLGEEHRLYWESLVDWVSGGVRDSILLRPERSVVPVGQRLVLHGEAGDVGSVSDRVLVASDGRIDTVDVRGVEGVPGAFEVEYTPDRPGLHTLVFESDPTDGESVLTAFRAVDSIGEDVGSWSALGSIVWSSGGRLLEGGDAGLGRGADRGLPSPFPWIALLTVIALLLPWGRRRLGGLP